MSESTLPGAPSFPLHPTNPGELSYPDNESVCGKDERARVANTQRPPYFWLCRLSMKFSVGDYIGSGWLVSTDSPDWDVVVTSGHCVYSTSSGEWAQSVTVVPGATRTTAPYGSWSVTKANLRAASGWLAGGADRSDHDYGVILIPKTGALGAVGMWVASDAELNGRTIRNAGYPGDRKPYGDCWTMDGPVSGVSARKIEYMNDTAGGQSGSGVFTLLSGNDWQDHTKIRVVGVHGYGGCPNSAVRINQEVYDQIIAWSK